MSADAEALKVQGNEHFKNRAYDEAIDAFTRAIAIDGSNHVYFSNRSAAYAGAERWSEAVKDAETTISLNPSFAKGYSRKGGALFGAGDLQGAREAYMKGLEVVGDDTMLRSGLQDVERVLAQKQSGDDSMSQIGSMFNSPDLMAKLASNPATRGYLSQPDFMTMLQAVQKDVNTLNQYLSDPRMMNVLSVAMGVRVMSGDDAEKEFAGNHEADSKPTRSAPEPTKSTPKAPEKAPEPELTEDRKRALAEKELGNAAYKARKFEEAIAHYNKAVDFDPEDVSFLNNRAAAKLEKGDYDACIVDCDSAVEIGRSLRADYTIIAKAMTRKANALVKQGKLEEAIDAYQRSLTEHRTADTLKRLNETEKALKEAKAAAYLDPALGEEARERGNALFKDQKFPEAVKEYTEAIARNPQDHKAYSNRSASYTKLTAFNEALKDAEKCIELDPTFAKGYTRKGHVQFFTKAYDEAIETYNEGLKHDPANAELKEGLRKCYEQINMGATGQLSEDELKQRQERAMANPEIQQILSDPVMRQVLQDMSTDPKAAAEHQRNPMVMAKIQKLVNAGIVQVR
jgi:stress-induced-phosphoprotein 1